MLPLPTSLSTPMVPPNSSANFFVIDNPRQRVPPLPIGEDENEVGMFGCFGHDKLHLQEDDISRRTQL